MLIRLADWLDHRTGFRHWVREACDEPVRGGSRWSYVFGSALVVTLAIQTVTGIALAAYYSPSATTAWASVNFIQNRVYLGWILRGMHHWGASAMVVLVVLHLLQTLWFGAFRSPREINWLTGFLMLHFVIGFALTGYLLPWDQKGFWATQVATSIVGTLPLIGTGLQELLQGGAEYGNLTLTRFYALHVFVLPAALIGFLVIHVYLFRRHGVTTPPGLSSADAESKTEPFFPGQLLKDTAFSLVVLAVVVWLSWRYGASLEAPADPSAQFLARPEWYFLPLFQLLKYFEGKYEIVGTVVIPGLVMLGLAALPFLHTWLQSRTTKAALMLASLVTAGLLGLLGLGVLAAWQDARNPAAGALLRQARQEAELARSLAIVGVPSTGPLDLYRNDPVLWGSKVFAKSCASCHRGCAEDPYPGAPCLEGYASRSWLRQLLLHPDDRHFFGNTKINEMDPWNGEDANLKAIVEFMYGEGGHSDTDSSLAQEGAALFDSEGCGACHELSGQGNGLAPDLKGYGTQAWLREFIRSPGLSRFYGGKNEMENFDCAKLSDAELGAVVAHIRDQGTRELKLR